MTASHALIVAAALAVYGICWFTFVEALVIRGTQDERED